MLNLDAETVARVLPYDQLVSALADAFAENIIAPQRSHLEVSVADGNPGNLLLMPAWQVGGGMGVKIATIFPDNAKQNQPAVFASYILMNAETGEPLAILDGSELTLRRTAATSALTSRYLSRENSSRLLMVGTGKLAPHMIAAHTTVRPIREVLIWGRNADAARQVAERAASAAFSISVVENLQEAVAAADIISCATLAIEPLIKGAWLCDGQHLDLVGAFRPDMREADTDAVVRASVFVDTRAGALAEAGEIVQALKTDSITAEDIVGELSELVTGKVTGRRNDNEVTLFKSVGAALEDLAAAELAVRKILAESNSQ
jgi:ornithine cyclodeaminase/alanine dehydrogenase-like protein (mu-crystallin family)